MPLERIEQSRFHFVEELPTVLDGKPDTGENNFSVAASLVERGSVTHDMIDFANNWGCHNAAGKPWY